MKPTFFTALLLLFLTIFSCQQDDGPVSYPEETSEYTNQWIREQMKKYYYWNNSIPDGVDLSLYPNDFFRQLLYVSDPFSYAIHPSLPETLPQSLRSKFGFDVAFIQFEGQVYGVILYVLSGSPAQNNGLQRGQLLKKINGIPLSTANFDGLYQDMVQSDNLQFQVVRYSEATGFSAPAEVQLSRGYTFSQPIQHLVLEQENQKIGYIAIPHFDVGQAGLFRQIFQDFKNQSINAIVVDLRYNGGGDVSSATALSIILASGIQPDDLFIRFKGNPNGGVVSQSFAEALAMNESQVGFAALRDVHPAVQKVYVLCGSHTASASEIIINNLKPFTNVVTIGEKTVGKDVAGFPIKDERIPNKPGWILYPAIYKLYNAQDQGNYSGGIPPSIAVNELQEIAVFPLGDPRELLLQRAVNIILGHQKTTGQPQTVPLPKPGVDTDAFVVLPAALKVNKTI